MFIKFNKSKEIYDQVIAHRGVHIDSPENTIGAYKKAIEKDLAIEIDIRFLKCSTIVCFHDRYMKRLLGIPGKLTSNTYDDIRRLKVKESNFNVPTLKEALKAIKGKVPVLIEVKGRVKESDIKNFIKTFNDYKGKKYIHVENLYTYWRLKKEFGDKVFWIQNPIRKRFPFLKGKHYSRMPSVPCFDDIVIELQDNTKTIVRKTWKVFNKNKSRVDENHWLMRYNGQKYQMQHRGIISKEFMENTLAAYAECVRKNKVIEVDARLLNGEVICYHDDNWSDKVGQPKSIAEKAKISNAPTLIEVLKIVDGRVPIIIDFKALKIRSRELEEKVLEIFKDYEGERVYQSINPLSLMYLRKKAPEIVRGQVGSSFPGLKKMRPLMIIINVVLFFKGVPDYIAYNLDSTVYVLSKFNNTVGLPVLGYAPQNMDELLKYKGYFDNLIIEFDYQEK